MGVYKLWLQPHLSWWNDIMLMFLLYCIFHHGNKVLVYSILFICEKDCLCGMFQVPWNQLYSRYLLNVKMLKSEKNGHYFADDISESRKENNLSFDSCFIEGRGFLRFIPAKPIKYIGPSHAIYYIERHRVYVVNLWIAIFKWLLIVFQQSKAQPYVIIHVKTAYRWTLNQLFFPYFAI